MGSYRAQSVGPIRRSGVVELGFRFRGCWAEYLILFQRIWECDRCVPLNQFLKKTCQFFSDFLWKIRDQQPLLSKVAVHRKQLFRPNKQDEDRFFYLFLILISKRVMTMCEMFIHPAQVTSLTSTQRQSHRVSNSSQSAFGEKTFTFLKVFRGF